MWEKQITYDFKYDLTYDFSMEQFIDFMMIPSNVNSKIENGKITEVEAREWFEKKVLSKNVRILYTETSRF